jgi:hypothetical protein
MVPDDDVLQEEELEAGFTSDLSSKNSTSTWSKYINCTWITAIFAALFIIVVGGGVGWGAAQVTEHNRSSREGNNATMAKKNSTNISNNWVDSNDFTAFGEDLQVIASRASSNRDDCYDFCSNQTSSTMVHYQSYENNCECLQGQGNCWLSWGDAVDSDKYTFSGYWQSLVTTDLEICNQTFCEMFEESGLCLTNHKENYQDYSLWGKSITAVAYSQQETTEACLNFCGAHDGASFLNWIDCSCYTNIDCWLPWNSNQVDTFLFYGTIYSKNPLDECNLTFCEAYESSLCLTENVYNYQEYSLYGESLTTAVVSNQTQGKEACLELCAPYDAAIFLNFQDCSCYSNPECLLEWSSSVDTKNLYGSIYSKSPLKLCQNTSYCQKFGVTSNLCFTGNARAYNQYSLQGIVAVNQTSKNVKSPDECLGYCLKYTAASFLNFQECTCYSSVECWQEWGDLVDTKSLFGTVYSKSPLDTCQKDFCLTNKNQNRCFTANSMDYKVYSLFGANMTETTNSGTDERLSEDECLEFCSEFDALRFWKYRQPSCTCFYGPECWLSWGNDTNNSDAYLFTGRVYSNKKLDVCS